MSNSNVTRARFPETKQGYSQQQLAQIRDMEHTSNKRSQEIDSIVKSINDLAELFKELSVLVVEQGSMLDRIDYNIESTLSSLKDGHKELDKVCNSHLHPSAIFLSHHSLHFSFSPSSHLFLFSKSVSYLPISGRAIRQISRHHDVHLHARRGHLCADGHTRPQVDVVHGPDTIGPAVAHTNARIDAQSHGT
jgi:hypothetical protein